MKREEVLVKRNTGIRGEEMEATGGPGRTAESIEPFRMGFHAPRKLSSAGGMYYFCTLNRSADEVHVTAFVNDQRVILRDAISSGLLTGLSFGAILNISLSQEYLHIKINPKHKHEDFL